MQNMNSSKTTVETAIAYVRQETVGALKPIGRFLALGMTAAFLFGVAAIFSALGFLRLLQEFDSLDGNWSFVPYLAVLIALIVAGGVVWQIGTRRRRP